MRGPSSFLRIERGEGRIAALVFASAFVGMTAHTLGESGIDALFFNKVGTGALATTYVIQGSTAFLVMLALTATMGRLGPRRTYLWIPLGLGALLLGERLLLFAGGRWVYVALWVTAAVAMLAEGVALWGVAGTVVDRRQAKRLFPLFAAGSILGAVIGGFVTSPVAGLLGTQNLMLVWSAGLAVVFVLFRVVLGTPTGTVRRPAHRRSAVEDIARAFRFVRSSSLLRWMTAAAVLFSVVFFLLYLPFARASAQRYPDPKALAGFFGLFWAGTTLGAFLVSILVSNRLFAWIGVAAALVILPSLYTVSFGVLLVSSGFVTLVVLRFGLAMWLAGVASPGWETLTNVIPENNRDQARAFLNGGPTQLGTVIAGLIAIVGTSLSTRQFAAIGLALAVVTIVATLGIRRSYASALADALRAGRPQVFQRPGLRQVPVDLGADADAARVLAESARSPDVRERRVALQLIAGLPADRRPSVAIRALHDEDPLVRASAVRAADPLDPAVRTAIASLVDDADPTVASAASAATVPSGRAEPRLRALLADPDPTVRLIAIDQLDLAPAEWQARIAASSLDDPAPEVRAAALGRLAGAAPDRAAESALPALRDPDPAVRVAAGRALGSAGPEPLGVVLEALLEPSTADAAAEAVRLIAVDGQDERVRGFVRTAAERATEDRTRAAAVPTDGELAALVREALVERGRRHARAGLWAASLVATRRAIMATAIENLDGPPAQVATALETLETASGDPPLVRPLLGLWEHPGDGGAKDPDWISAALRDEDPIVRGAAELLAARQEGGSMPDTPQALSTIERILFLRKVSLFADLPPADLERIARLVEEEGYADGDLIAAEDELGEDAYIVVEGSVQVVQGQGSSARTVARRAAGEVVGEMSLITQTPRIASLVAEGPVRTIRLGHQAFASMLRERPSIALSVTRVLAQRLAEIRQALTST